MPRLLVSAEQPPFRVDLKSFSQARDPRVVRPRDLLKVVPHRTLDSKNDNRCMEVGRRITLASWEKLEEDPCKRLET